MSERGASSDGAVAFLTAAGAADTPHPSGTLLAHLCGTRDLLRRWGCPEHLCAAGLYHSVYGTEAFRTTTVELAERARVRARIGAEAEDIVHLYCVIVRRTLFDNLGPNPPLRVVRRASETPIPIDARQLADLITLDLANRLEQLPRVPMSLWRMERDRRRYAKAAPLLPPAAVAEMRNVYRPRSVVVVAADAAYRLVRRFHRRRG